MHYSPIGQWLRKNEVAAWLGVAVGLVQIAAGPAVFGWATPAGIGLVAFGALLTGGILTFYLISPPRYQLKCLSCESTHILTKQSEGWLLTSANPAYAPRAVKNDEVEHIHRVAYVRLLK